VNLAYPPHVKETSAGTGAEADRRPRPLRTEDTNMRAQLAKYWHAVRASYWFVPGLMAVGAIVLSLVTTLIDQRFGIEVIRDLDWISFNTPAGARSLLSTIAGSMITVAGVTFSITIAAVAYAASQLGPRLLGNFMRDTSNQVTLGTFIATFVYCLLILRTVHGGGDGNTAVDAFVPHVGVMLALILTLASLGVLIYFFHHTPVSIQASEVVAQIGEELNHKVAALFPDQLGAAPPEGAEDAGAAAAYPAGGGTVVRARTSGYITHIDSNSLFGLARTHDLVLRLVRRPGDFVSSGEPLAFVHGDGADADVPQGRIALAFALDRKRTQAQDLLFIVQQLVEVAARALSPGINDPYTATSCMDWLGSALINLGCRAMPDPYRYDDDGGLRIIAPNVTYADVAAAVFDDLRPYAAGDRNAALHLMGVIERIFEGVEHPIHRAVLLHHAAAVKEAAEASLSQGRDTDRIADAFDRLKRAHDSALVGNHRAPA
jgi:uncharacterized membrane protein